MSLRTYPDLSAECLKTRLDLPLRLWYLLRQNCPGGRGWLYLEDVLHLGIGSKRQVRTWLKKGEGLFWHHDDQGRLWLHSLAKVSMALGVKPVKPPVAIPISDIQNLARFRAALFVSWFADAGPAGRVISQGTLSAIFGRTPRTLRTWAKLANLDVIHNLALAPVPEPGDDLSKYPPGTLETLSGGAVKTWQDDPGKTVQPVWFERRDRTTFLAWQIPSTYTSTLAVGPKTTLQKRAARQILDNPARIPVKLYYRRGGDGKAIARALEQHSHVYFETNDKHAKTGERLWLSL